VEKSRIDISHYKRITPTELEEIELVANKLVMDNINVNTFWLERTMAEKKYGFILYQGGVVPGMNIRTVEIEGIDVQACGGTHCNQTGDIGLIKITRTERIQDGVERIEFSAGESAIKAVQNNDHLLKESSGVFKVDAEQLPQTCERFFTEWKAFKNEIDRLKNEIASLKIEGITSQTEAVGDLIILNRQIEADMGELVKIASNLTETGKADVVVIINGEGKIAGAASPKALEKGIKINDVIKEAAGIMDGGGGGKPNLAQGAGRDTTKIAEALDAVSKYLEKIG
jgi:alanyl-tRNA synthetase